MSTLTQERAYYFTSMFEVQASLQSINPQISAHAQFPQQAHNSGWEWGKLDIPSKEGGGTIQCTNMPQPEQNTAGIIMLRRIAIMCWTMHSLQIAEPEGWIFSQLQAQHFTKNNKATDS